MFERFRRDSRAVVLDAMKEARVRADARIEAEHLLLALARRSAWDAGRVLAEAGIDHDGLRAALDDEVRHTLEAVGVGSGETWIPESTLPAAGQPRWGESAKMALRRATIAAKDRGDRQLTPTHILIGVLRAREGTVPGGRRGGGRRSAELAAHAEGRSPSRRVSGRSRGFLDRSDGYTVVVEDRARAVDERLRDRLVATVPPPISCCASWIDRKLNLDTDRSPTPAPSSGCCPTC
jgi:ATP-dependent Clp protease ATP-binding subunit ClpA